MRILSFARFKDILFNNKSVRQTVFKNTFWITFAQCTTKLLKLILLIYVARVLGATEYGKFSFALALTGFFILFVDLGIPRITTREFSKEREKERDFHSLFTLEVVLTLAVLGLIILSSFFITSSLDIRKMIWLLAIYSVTHGLGGIIYAFFRARQQMQYEAFSAIFQAGAITLLSFLVIFSFPSAQNLSYAYAIGGLIFIIFVLIFFHFKISPLKIKFSKKIWKNYLSMSWPLALVGVLGLIYGQMDSVMMGFLNQITEVGWYTAAYRIIGTIVIPASFISSSFFPVLSKYFHESKVILQRIFWKEIELMIIIASPIMIGGLVLASKIIEFVYGQEYLPAVSALQVLLILAGISFVYNPFSHILIVANQQKKIFGISFSGAVINIALNMILIPKYTLYGAAVATLITWIIMFLLFIICTFLFTPIKLSNLRFLTTIFFVIIASLIMYIFISRQFIYNLHVLFSITIGCIVYFSILFLIDLILGRFNYRFLEIRR